MRASPRLVPSRQAWKPEADISDISKSEALGMQADKRYRNLNLQLMVLSFACTALLVIEEEMCFQHTLLIFDDDCTVGEYFEYAMWGISIITFQRLCALYATKAKSHQKQWGFVTPWHAFVGTRDWIAFSAEVLVLAVQPVKFLGLWYSQLMVVFAILRLYLLVRCVRDFSRIYRLRRQLVHRSHVTIGSKQWVPPHYQVNGVTVLKTLFFTHTVSQGASTHPI